MKSIVDSEKRSMGYLASGLAFLASFGFFLIAYPYHLFRREQLNVFVYDCDYIVERFNGIGWLSRFLGSFTDQFFCVRVLGPVIIALLLTAIGTHKEILCQFGQNDQYQ